MTKDNGENYIQLLEHLMEEVGQVDARSMATPEMQDVFYAYGNILKYLIDMKNKEPWQSVIAKNSSHKQEFTTQNEEINSDDGIDPIKAFAKKIEKSLGLPTLYKCTACKRIVRLPEGFYRERNEQIDCPACMHIQKPEFVKEDEQPEQDEVEKSLNGVYMDSHLTSGNLKSSNNVKLDAPVKFTCTACKNTSNVPEYVLRPPYTSFCCPICGLRHDNSFNPKGKSTHG